MKLFHDMKFITNALLYGANYDYPQSVFWTSDFEKKFWISIKKIRRPKYWIFMKILVKILDFYKKFRRSPVFISTKNFIEVQYFDKKFHRIQYFGT